MPIRFALLSHECGCRHVYGNVSFPLAIMHPPIHHLRSYAKLKSGCIVAWVLGIRHTVRIDMAHLEYLG